MRQIKAEDRHEVQARKRNSIIRRQASAYSKDKRKLDASSKERSSAAKAFADKLPKLDNFTKVAKPVSIRQQVVSSDLDESPVKL